jgi:hypothetical protein
MLTPMRGPSQVAALALIGALSASRAGLAQQPSEDTSATAPARPLSPAEKLFFEGRARVVAGDHASACVYFEESRKLEPEAGGTLLNLGLCNEALRRYATAASYYRNVIERSRGTRQDRVDIAEAHLKEVEPKIAHMQIAVPDEARLPGLVVKLDGVEIGADKWGSDMPLDGGEHEVVASAPNKKELRLRVPVQHDRGNSLVTITRLEELPDTRTIGFVVGGAGVVSLAVGAVLGISVASQCGGFFQDHCDALDRAKQQGGKQYDNEQSSLDMQAWISNVTIGLGVVGIGIGTYLVLTSPAHRRARSQVVGLVPLVAPGGGGAGVRGTF